MEVKMKFDREKYLSYCFDTVKRLMAVPSPSGYSVEIASLVREITDELGLKLESTRKSCFICTYEGEDSSSPLGIAAHCDTLGAMVRSIGGDGTLSFTAVGGLICNSLDGEYCFVITREGKRYDGTILSRSPSVHVYPDARSRTRDPDNMYVRLDENVHSADDVRALGIENGDYICFDPKTTVTGSGYLKSRFIDDKASVACILTALKILRDSGIVPKNDIKFLISMYEEVGHGAAFVPDGLTSMLAVDMGCVGSDLSGDEHKLSICAKDGGGPYDYELTGKLISLAKEASLPYCVDIFPYYGSDIGAMWSAGHDVPGALIGPGVHASHGMERTHADALMATVELILLYFGV